MENEQLPQAEAEAKPEVLPPPKFLLQLTSDTPIVVSQVEITPKPEATADEEEPEAMTDAEAEREAEAEVLPDSSMPMAEAFHETQTSLNAVAEDLREASEKLSEKVENKVSSELPPKAKSKRRRRFRLI